MEDKLVAHPLANRVLALGLASIVALAGCSAGDTGAQVAPDDTDVPISDADEELLSSSTTLDLPDELIPVDAPPEGPVEAEEAIAELEEETDAAPSIGGTASDAEPSALIDDTEFLAEAPTPDAGATSIELGTALIELGSQTPALAGPPSWGGEVGDRDAFEASIRAIADDLGADVTESDIGFDFTFPDGSTGQLRHENWLNWLYVAN